MKNDGGTSSADEALQLRSTRNIPIRELDKDLDTSEENEDVDFKFDHERIMDVVDGVCVDDLKD